MAIYLVTLPISTALTATEASSQLARALWSNDRTLGRDEVIQVPLVEGGEGTLDFLVTHSLGSFLEVEIIGADGEDAVVPLGLAGEDGKLAVIEMRKALGVDSPGGSGTTYGVGELIHDALDESAFSILLGHDEPLAADAGLGIGAALGVKFFAENGEELDMKRPIDLNSVAKIDATGRSFQLLSSRFFVAQTRATRNSTPSESTREQYAHLASIVQRDCGVTIDVDVLSASGVEIGLQAFLNAQIAPGSPLILEAANLGGDQTGSVVFFANAAEELLAAREALEKFSSAAHLVCLIREKLGDTKPLSSILPDAPFLSLADAPLFQPPLKSDASSTEIRRDILMRLEKITPKLNDMLRTTRAKANVRA